jgi:hypothetical protein
LSALLATGILIAFALPFASVSCSEVSGGNYEIFETTGSIETERLTGWELVGGKSPELTIGGSVGQDTRDQVQTKVDNVRGMVVVLFILAVSTIALAGAVAIRNCGKCLSVLFFISPVYAAVFALLFLDFEVTYHAGFFTTMVLSGGVVALNSWLYGQRSIDRGRSSSFFVLGGAVTAAGMILVGVFFSLLLAGLIL